MRSLFVVTVLFGLSVANLAAQEEGPKDFYDNDFVNSGPKPKIDINRGLPYRPRGLASASPSPEASDGNPVSKGQEFISVDADPTPQESPTPAKVAAAYQHLPNIEPQKINGLSLVLNGMDGEINRQYLRDLYNLCAQHKIEIDNLYVVGPTRFWKLADNLTVGVFGGKLRTGSEPDTPFPLKTAPTWVVRTEKNSVILEGLKNIKQFITPAGQLYFK